MVYRKACSIIVYIIFALSVNIPVVYGMDTCRYHNQDLKSGDFTPFLDDMVQRIIGYLYTSLSDDCRAEDFNDPIFRARLRRSQYNNKKGLGRLDMTCKRFILLDNPCMITNKIILSDLLFELLRPSHHNKNTASRIELCIGAGADVNYRNEWNETPLVYAISTPPCHQFINVLIKEGAQINQVGALEKAKYYGHSDIVDLLVGHGAELMRIDECDSDDDSFCSSSESYSVSETFPAYSTSSDDDFFDAPASDGALHSSGDSILGDVLSPYDDALSAAEDYDSKNDDDDSKSDNIPLPQPPIPEPIPDTIPDPIPEPTGGGAQNNFDDSMFATVLRSVWANPLSTLMGVVAGGGFCYWAYNKYQAYMAPQEQSGHDEQTVNEEMA